MPVPWELIVGRLKRMIELSDKSMSAHARDMRLSPAALSRILSGKTEEPQPNTQDRIRSYVQRELERTAYGGAYLPEEEERIRVANETASSVEQDLLEYFLENHQQMATLMSRTSEGLSPEERRKVALALLNAFKRMAIEAGQKIPPFLYELERRFVEE